MSACVLIIVYCGSRSTSTRFGALFLALFTRPFLYKMHMNGHI